VTGQRASRNPRPAGGLFAAHAPGPRRILPPGILGTGCGGPLFLADEESCALGTQPSGRDGDVTAQQSPASPGPATPAPGCLPDRPAASSCSAGRAAGRGRACGGIRRRTGLPHDGRVSVPAGTVIQRRESGRGPPGSGNAPPAARPGAGGARRRSRGRRPLLQSWLPAMTPHHPGSRAGLPRKETNANDDTSG
jgi:hypothetical protein